MVCVLAGGAGGPHRLGALVSHRRPLAVLVRPLCCLYLAQLSRSRSAALHMQTPGRAQHCSLHIKCPRILVFGFSQQH